MREINALKLKFLIVDRNTTQEEVAKKIGISRNSMARKLKGVTEFKLSEVKKIIDLLKIDNPGEIFFDN